MKEDGTMEYEFEWTPAILCREKYAKYIEENPDNEVAKKILQGRWICPKADEMKL